MNITGDGQLFWDNLDTISKTDIYQSLQQFEPSQYETNAPMIIKALKYIFVMMSQGRNDIAMEFYHIILLKLIHIPNYEIRKMVYIYILQYANYNTTTRELSLLSINTFQKGLQDFDPMIRALALRVLTSIQLVDIIPIQMLAITKHVHTDTSVHVRQCAMMAIAKVVSRITTFENDSQQQQQQRQVLLELIQSVLQQETNINVLSSAMIAFYEYCTTTTNSSSTASTTQPPHSMLLHDSLYILHSCFYKLCHLICDMDEYIQVIVLDLLSRYCRQYFQQPYYYQMYGSAYIIDQQRKVTRPKHSTMRLSHPTMTSASTNVPITNGTTTSFDSFWNGSGSVHHPSNTVHDNLPPLPMSMEPSSASSVLPPHPSTTTTSQRRNVLLSSTTSTATNTMKRRIIKKGFYSDEEDDSTEEEIEIQRHLRGGGGNNVGTIPISSNTTGFNDIDPHSGITATDSNHNATATLGMNTNNHNANTSNNPFAFEEEDLHEDHKLLLHSVRPLFKSRNAGVVLAVCTLQYYCGIASIPIRKQIGKSLVRIYKSNNKRSIEIQYVVLSSIRQLVQNDCPSAFAPFLQDFFILPNIDPNFTRMIKLDILTYLSIDPPSIIAVLNELRTYVQIPYNTSNDSNMEDVYFVCASIRTVGRITEIARIVFDRHAQLLVSSQQQQNDTATAHTAAATIRQYRTESNTIALNCLYGLITFSKVHEHHNEISMMIIGETIQVLQRILHLMFSDENDNTIQDDNRVRDQALHRILLLLVNTLSTVMDDNDDDGGDDEVDSDDDNDNPTDANSSMKEKLQQQTIILPPAATAAAIWLMGEYLASPIATGSTNVVQSYGKFFTPEQRSKLCFELLRLLIRSFNMLDPPEKEQAIHFASKMLLSYHGTSVASFSGGSNDIVTNIPPLCEHLLALGRYDTIPDLRDRARFESAMIHSAIGLRYDTDGLDDIPNHNKMLSVTDVQRIFLSTKPASTYLPLNGSDFNVMNGNNPVGMSSESLEDGNFRFGTLSSLVGHKARSAYIPLPPWADKNSDSSIRAEKRGDVHSSKASAIGGRPVKGSEFYQSSSDDDDSTSSESSDSESESSDDDSDDESDTESDTDFPAASTQTMPPQANLFQPTVSLSIPQQPSRPPIEIENASDDESSSDDDSDDDSNSDSEDDGLTEELFPAASKNNVTLIPIQNRDKNNTTHVTAAATTASSSSVLDDMRGLVLEPVVVSANESRDAETSIYNIEASGWMTLVRSEHAGGLLVEGRYLRHRTKIEQAQTMGFIPSDQPTIVILQVRLTNQKDVTSGGGSISSSSTIRNIRFLQQSSSSSSQQRSTTIGPRKVMIVPSEIAEVSVQHSVTCQIGIDFTQLSDRDNSYCAKIELKYGSSSLPNSVTMDVKPTIGDMLLPYSKPCSVLEFDTFIRRMQGFSRIESHWALEDVLPKQQTSATLQISERILSRAALTLVVDDHSHPKSDNDTSFLSSSLRWIGLLPASKDPIYVMVSWNTSPKNAKLVNGTILVCCDHALVANAFIQLLKRSILETTSRTK